MKIFCSHFSYAAQLEKLGHEVFAPNLPGGITHLPSFLEKSGFAPDLVIQEEILGERVFFGGLEEMPCPTVFISVDTHLNLFWQRYYARLFDMVMSANLSFIGEIPWGEGPGRLSPRVGRLGPCGYARPWRDFSAREHGLAFCGILDQYRTVRTAMLELLEKNFALYRPAGRLERQAMLELFGNARIIPNEAIRDEVNFRLFEAASCGCLVLTPDIGEDQNVHFEPGKEMVTYANVLELLDKAAFYLSRPAEAEKIGRAARARVLSCHLPEHRAAEVLDYASRGGARAGGNEAVKCFALTLVQMARHGSHPLPATELLRILRALPEDGESAAAILALLSESTRPESPLYAEAQAGWPEEARREGLDLCLRLLAKNLYRDSTACNLAASFHCLHLGDLDKARLFWLRQRDKQAVQDGGSGAAGQGRFPEKKEDFYLFWADLLVKQGFLAQPGFRFRPHPGFLPQTALECLLLALEGGEGAERRDVWLRMERLYSALPGYAPHDLAMLANLSLHSPKSWRWQALYGICSLKCMRVEAGLAELESARASATAIGQEGAFKRLLAEHPGWEYTLRRLYPGISA
ncbi:glycosyltransferase [Desulfovibrio sp. OttesenSCG-928-C14]|nr:glycosyltransferase [Desulfovibrio sp. OttesenSCG-928-C14]